MENYVVSLKTAEEQIEFWKRQFTKVCQERDHAKRLEDLIREIVREELASQDE